MFKVGIILQTVSFVFFDLLVAVFTYRVYSKEKKIWTADSDAGKQWYRDWRALLGALMVACITILVRDSCLVPKGENV